MISILNFEEFVHVLTELVKHSHSHLVGNLFMLEIYCRGERGKFENQLVKL